ncbi:MAG: ABC transporter ATP-binding protein [Flavobacteriales bacterium]|nr:ABC transporter ATP-binding protein [Flavobacteriales bacterium]
MIHFKQTEIGYKSPLINVADLTLEAGKVYALVGRNGSGKSTFLRSITGQNPLISGDININSVSFKKANAIEKSKTIAFVESKFDGIAFLSVADYLALGRAPYTNALGRLSQGDWDFVRQVANEIGIEAFMQKDTLSLSDGERQLCAIARAIVQETPVLLLDEPSAFLDYANKQILVDKLLQIANEKQKCIVFSTHDLDLCIENKLEFLALKNNTLTKVNGLNKLELIGLLEGNL